MPRGNRRAIDGTHWCYHDRPKQVPKSSKPSQLALEIAAIKTHSELFEYMYRRCSFRFAYAAVEDAKNDHVANNYMMSGDIIKDTKKYLKTMICYTRALGAAKSNELKAQIYWKRSEILLKWRRVEECLAEMDRIMEICPSYSDMVQERREKARSLTPNVNKYHDDVPTIDQPHRTLPNAANCIDVQTDQKHGRHIVASRDIKIGEILVIEKPIATTILKKAPFHCHECCKLCYDLIPCDNCMRTFYCGEECKENARSFHCYECFIFRRAEVLYPNTCHYNFLNLKLTFMLMENEQLQQEVFKLQNHFTKTPEYILTDIMEKICLFYDTLKNYCNFFKSAEQEQAFKKIFTTISLISNTNARYISDLDDELDQRDVGAGLYLTTSLFNHSCVPNVVGVLYGTTRVLRAVRPIQKGKQCFIAYTFRFEEHRSPHRQSMIKNYFGFDCKCNACKNKWLTLEATHRFPGEFKVIRDFAVTVLQSEDVDFVKASLPECISNLLIVEKSSMAIQDRAIFVKAVEQCLRVFGNRHYN